jgi:hypothetical protein
MERFPMLYLGAAKQDDFVASFCTPRQYEDVYKNILGGFTPCFCDVVLLGVFLLP